MKAPHLARVEEGPEAFAALAAALAAAGLRFGWLEWTPPAPLPASLAAAGGLGALRAVAVGGGLSAAIKPIGGPPVLKDILRQHFLGCALVMVRGGAEPARDAVGGAPDRAGLPLLAPAGEGRYRLAGADGDRTYAAEELAARLRSPRPLAGTGGTGSGAPPAGGARSGNRAEGSEGSTGEPPGGAPLPR